MDKKYKYGIVAGAGILALAAGVIALSKFYDEDKIKDGAEKFKEEASDIASAGVEKVRGEADKVKDGVRNEARKAKKDLKRAIRKAKREVRQL